MDDETGTDINQEEAKGIGDSVSTQQFVFTEDQYQGLLTLLQQSQISTNNHVSNQVSITPSHPTAAAQS
ncbi:hypothetical protein SESBI_06695, partial [Sesbania bispinosa]